MIRGATILPEGCHRHRELIFWLPIGLISLFYLLASPNPTSNEGNSPAAKHTTVHLDYELVENSSTTNAQGDHVNILRYAARERAEDGSFTPISALRWARLLSRDDSETEERVRVFLGTLANAPMDAFFFETPGVAYGESRDRPFEFALTESPYLYRFADAAEDPHTFRARFDECEDESVGCAFSNPSGTSVLIAPMPMTASEGATNGANNANGHLAAFVRRAPIDRVSQFWKLVMGTYVERLKSEDGKKVWLSTDGTGVAWLHVRLDPTPKYYDYKPYAEGGER